MVPILFCNMHAVLGNGVNNQVHVAKFCKSSNNVSTLIKGMKNSQTTDTNGAPIQTLNIAIKMKVTEHSKGYQSAIYRSPNSSSFLHRKT